jgi:hypothetical protein
MKTDNELIAEFMKLDKHPNNERAYWIEDEDCYLTFDNLQFHRSWNQLMPVVHKIKKDRHNPNEMFMGTTLERYCAYSTVTELPIWASIDSVHSRVVEFIKWYNAKQIKKNYDTK